MDSIQTLITSLRALGDTLDDIAKLKGKKKGRWEAIRSEAEDVKTELVDYALEQLATDKDKITYGSGTPSKSICFHIQGEIDGAEKKDGLLGLAQIYERYHMEEIKKSRSKGKEKLDLLEELPGQLSKVEEDAEDYLDDLDEANEDSKINFKKNPLYGHFKNGVTLTMKGARTLKRFDLEKGKGEEFLTSFFSLANEIKGLVKDVSSANKHDEIKTLARNFCKKHYDNFVKLHREAMAFKIEPEIKKRKVLKNKVTNQGDIDAWKRARKAFDMATTGAFDLFDTLDKMQ
ncbi:MAG: hypothetical protein AAF502_22395 [Bacteroidota bacterium]